MSPICFFKYCSNKSLGITIQNRFPGFSFPVSRRRRWNNLSLLKTWEWFLRKLNSWFDFLDVQQFPSVKAASHVDWWGGKKKREMDFKREGKSGVWWKEEAKRRRKRGGKMGDWEKRRQKQLEKRKKRGHWGKEEIKGACKKEAKGETEENEKGLEKRKSNRRYRLILGF